MPRRREDPELGFADLRRRGIGNAQSLSGEIWTDYNHHDPGVTLLEALCFALTGSVFGAEARIADLLTAPDGRIHYRRHGMHRAEEALPCRPATRWDLTRYLLDRVPALRHARVDMPERDGVWRLALRAPAGLGDALAAEAARAFWSARNLAEDLAMPPGMLAPRWCALRLSLGIGGGRDLTDILAELVERCDALIGMAPPRHPPHSRLSRLGDRDGQEDSDALFDGPVTHNDWITDEDLRREPAPRLHFADLARELESIEGVDAIDRLALVPLGEDAPDADESGIDWQGEGWALQLRWPDTPADIASWTVVRRGSRLTLDAAALLEQLADRRNIGKTPGAAMASAVSAPLGRPSGQYMAPSRYLSFWHHLPPLYQLAHAPPAASAGMAAQFGGYLILLEQWLAHGDAQLAHLRELFSLTAQAQRSYWWEPLDDRHLPILGPNSSEARERALRAADEALERRGRVLDFLLALHGEGCGQNSLQRFGHYFSPRDWPAHLFECKRQFLLRIVRHTRDRSAGFDYSRPSLGRKSNTAPLAERIALLLGFTHAHSRRLNARLEAIGCAVSETRGPEPGEVPPSDLRPLMLWVPARERIAALYAEDVRVGRVAARLAHYFAGLDLAALPGPLLRCAVHEDRYRRLAGADTPLWLGPDENGRWWPLDVRVGRAGVRSPAMYLHAFACDIQREAEGVHLVEPVLLRPLADGTEPDRAGYAHRILLVFPGWTARTADPSFRDLARETVAESCPAHILPQIYWPDAGDLARFERSYAAWLDARQVYCAALTHGRAVDAAITGHDRHAADLLRLFGEWDAAGERS
ncbi:hypothetical protein GCM10011289_16540 [Paludibacterium paludis]|uniref:Uncharacterized protein n=1 Tax=Paludibacterium paludis TaxID=1225769 RepID=A0A918P276_9NEIS|nr:hypothetical protein GCM10011289_16540 [Paludibacterium paludis]